MGFGSSQTVQHMTEYKEANGLTWTFAEGPDRMVRDFGILSQSTKLGIAPDGLITFMKGYGENDASYWNGVLSGLRDLGRAG